MKTFTLLFKMVLDFKKKLNLINLCQLSTMYFWREKLIFTTV